MEDFHDPFEPSPPPPWSTPVRCKVCGEVYGSDELYLNTDTDEWCCRDYPKCSGHGTEIELLPPDAEDSC
jgi:hypothetical protein